MTINFLKNQNFFVVLVIATIVVSSTQLIDGSTLESFFEKNKSSPNLCKFVDMYKPPQNICVLIEENKEYLVTLKKNNHPVLLDVVPGFYYKGPKVERVFNATRLQHFINKHNLTCLRVAKKYVYPIDEVIVVFTQKVFIGSKPLVPLSLQEVQQVAFLAEETGYKDFGWFDFDANLKRDTDDKIVFIDTENRSFYAGIQCLSSIPKKSRAQALYSLLFYNNCMTQEAVDWLKNRLAHVLEINAERYKNNVGDSTVLDSYEFDDIDIDTKEFYKEIQDQIHKRKIQKKIKKKGRKRILHPAQ